MEWSATVHNWRKKLYPGCLVATIIAGETRNMILRGGGKYQAGRANQGHKGRIFWNPDMASRGKNSLLKRSCYRY